GRCLDLDAERLAAPGRAADDSTPAPRRTVLRCMGARLARLLSPAPIPWGLGDGESRPGIPLHRRRAAAWARACAARRTARRAPLAPRARRSDRRGHLRGRDLGCYGAPAPVAAP